MVNMTKKQPVRSDRGGEAIVLGQQLAAAYAAESLWKELRAGRRSPLPEGSYDFWRGDLDLINPAPNPLDEGIRAVCRRYAQLNGPERSAMRCRLAIRRSISMDEFYTLMAFAKRTAVFGVREANAGRVADGLTAIAMIEEKRVDFRDILWCLGLLCYAANRAGGNADEMFRAAASLAEPEVARLVANTAEQSAKYRDIHCSCYEEVETDNGIGFIGWGGSGYRPTIDLKSAILDISKLVTSDFYRSDGIEVATDLPDYWLGSSNKSRQQRILSHVRAGATLSARLRPDIHPDHDSQQFTVFLVEAANESDAQALCRMAETNDSPHHCELALARSRLSCLVVARSFMEGVAGYETKGSLMRFAPGLAAALEHHAGG